MPCYNSITLDPNLELANLALLEEALKALGYEVQRDEHSLSARSWNTMLEYENGALQLISAKPRDDTSILSQAIRQAYTRAALLKAAEKFGWNVQQGKEKNQVTLRKV
jgi:hypothetical protein